MLYFLLPLHQAFVILPTESWIPVPCTPPSATQEPVQRLDHLPAHPLCAFNCSQVASGADNIVVSASVRTFSVFWIVSWDSFPEVGLLGLDTHCQFRFQKGFTHLLYPGQNPVLS